MVCEIGLTRKNRTFAYGDGRYLVYYTIQKGGRETHRYFNASSTFSLLLAAYFKVSTPVRSQGQ